MSETNGEGLKHDISTRDVFYLFFRHKWKMIFFFLFVAGSVALFTAATPEIYRSQAKLLVRLGRESVSLDPTAAIGPTITVSQSRESEIKSEIEMLEGRDLVEKMVDAIGQETFYKSSNKDILPKNAAQQALMKIRGHAKSLIGGFKNLLVELDLVSSYNEREKLVLGIMNDIRIGNPKNSNIITISYESPNPQLSRLVVEKIVSLYLEKHINVHQTPESYQFFMQQTDQLRAKLENNEKELWNLKNTSGIASLSEQQRVASEWIGTLEHEIAGTEAELASSKAKVESLQKALAQIPDTIVTTETTGFPNYSADTMRADLFKLQIEELKLKANFTEDSRKATEIREQIAQAQKLLSKEEAERTQITRGLNATRQELEHSLLTEQTAVSGLQFKLEAQKKQLENAMERLKSLNDAEVKIVQISREIATHQTNYQKYQENLEQARIDHALETERISNISIVEPATLPISPVKPRKLLNLFLGFVLGAFGAIFLAGICEFYLDHSIKTPDEAERRLHLPTLIAIPRVRRCRVRSVNNRLVKNKTEHNSTDNINHPKPVTLEVSSKVKRHYEVLREMMNKKMNGDSNKPFVLGVVGCHRGEGVSTVASNLSITLSRHLNTHLLLLDADTKRPSIERVFHAHSSPGLTDFLMEKQINGKIIQVSPVENLHIITAGRTHADLSEVFDSNRFTKLINVLKSRYSILIIDIPALNEVGASNRLASMCDGVLFVVEAEHLRREAIQRAKEQLLKMNTNIIGIILNKRRFHIPGWLYKMLA